YDAVLAGAEDKKRCGDLGDETLAAQSAHRCQGGAQPAEGGSIDREVWLLLENFLRAPVSRPIGCDVVFFEGKRDRIALLGAEDETRRWPAQIEKKSEHAGHPRRIFPGVDLQHRRRQHRANKAARMIVQVAQKNMR